MTPLKARWVRLGLLGLLVFLITLFMRFPASLASAWVGNHIEGKLAWQSASGTLFDARLFGIVIKFESGRAVYLDRADLKTSVFRLLTGRIVSDVSTNFGESVIDARLSLGISRWRIDSLAGTIELSDISILVPELELLGVHGGLVLSGNNIAGIHNLLPDSGKVEIDITDLQLTLVNSNRPLGNYRLVTVAIDEDGVRGKLATVSADSQLFIDGEVRMGGRENTISIRGQGWAGRDADQAVRELLPLLGRVQYDRAQINWSTML